MVTALDDLPLDGEGWAAIVAEMKAAAKAAWLKWGDEGLRRRSEANRREAQRYLDRMWTKALRGPVDEPRASQGIDSGVRLAVAEAMARRLAFRGVDPDLAAVLVAAWGLAYCEPPLEEIDAVTATRRAFPTARKAA